MKKIFVLTLVVVTIVSMLFVGFSFVGCKAAEEPPAEEPPAEEPAEEPPAETETGEVLIGVTMPTKSLQRWNQDGENIKKQLEAKGYKVDLQYAENDVNTQLSQIENQITKGCKVLIIASIDGSALGEVLKKAADAGIKSIAYDRLIMETPNVDYYTSFDNFRVGEFQARYIEETLGVDKGNGPFNIELFAGSPDDNNAFILYDGSMSVIKPYIDNGQLVVVSGQTEFTTIATPAWKSETAQARMDNIITAHYAGGTKLDAVLCPNDSTAIGVIAALDNVGYGSADKPYPIITGQDCDIPNVIAIIEGKQAMSVFKDTRTLAAKAVEMVEAIINGTEVPVNNTEDYDNGVKVVPSFLCDPVVVTKDNYKEMLIDSGYYTEEQLTK